MPAGPARNRPARKRLGALRRPRRGRLLLLLVALGSGWVVRRYTGSLAASRDALARCQCHLENAVDERTADLRRANDEIQRFA